MIVVIQCAAKKSPNAGYFQSNDGKPVFFVADPTAAPERPTMVYARPDDADSDGISWRQKLVEYNEGPDDNPFGLLPAWKLYANSAYELLHDRFGAKKLFILSAGWGLISADFLTPVYDITFSASAEKYKRRRKKGRYDDLYMLPKNSTEQMVFLSGKDYVGLFSELTRDHKGERVVFYNSATPPQAEGCTLKRYQTTTRTNWHYEAARALVESRSPPSNRSFSELPKNQCKNSPANRTGSRRMASKYDPLRRRLLSLSSDVKEITITFVELEKLLSFELPKSATDYRQWWANQTDTESRSQADAWMSAGWKVDQVAIKRPGGYVRFRR